MVDSKTNGEENKEPTYSAPPSNHAQKHIDQIKIVSKVTENNFNPFDDWIKDEDIPF